MTDRDRKEYIAAAKSSGVSTDADLGMVVDAAELILRYEGPTDPYNVYQLAAIRLKRLARQNVPSSYMLTVIETKMRNDLEKHRVSFGPLTFIPEEVPLPVSTNIYVRQFFAVGVEYDHWVALPGQYSGDPDTWWTPIPEGISASVRILKEDGIHAGSLHNVGGEPVLVDLGMWILAADCSETVQAIIRAQIGEKS